MEYDLESIGNALGYLSSAGGNVRKWFFLTTCEIEPPLKALCVVMRTGHGEQEHMGMKELITIVLKDWLSYKALHDEQVRPPLIWGPIEMLVKCKASWTINVIATCLNFAFCFRWGSFVRENCNKTHSIWQEFGTACDAGSLPERKLALRWRWLY